jgi:hypothetical protein
MAGITATAGAGSAVTYETGIALSKDKKGNWQIGTYQISGMGFMAGVGAGTTLSGSWAPFAQRIEDIKGITETVGGSGALGIVAFGGDVNVPINGPLKNFYVSIHAGISTPGAEGHAMTTTTTAQVYGEGTSLKEAWQKAIDSGMLNGLPGNMLEHFQEAYTTKFQEQLPMN